MNKEWSELCKTMQAQIKKKETFYEGIDTLLKLRGKLADELYRLKTELKREELNLDELYRYAASVKNSTEDLLKNLSFSDLKRKMTDTDKERLKSLNVVSEDERACWLIDYWCGKDVKGLILMPFSRHWIMHVEASLRIKNKICPL